jgi:membrane-bound metal-dependent hydrolase YbcI (DUF457 family)
MFAGHFALGFAAKRATPKISLAVLFAAAQLADLLWPVFVAVGLEEVRIDPGNTAFTPLDFVSYPYSHSLAALCLWGIVLGAICFYVARDLRTFLVVSGLVVSHWVLDFVTHRADMPLYPGSATFGLALWNSVPATIAVELLLYAAGVWMYLRTTRARDRVGRWSFGSLALVLGVLYLANIAGGTPPSVAALCATAITGGALITLWSWWTDRHREPVG